MGGRAELSIHFKSWGFLSFLLQRSESRLELRESLTGSVDGETALQNEVSVPELCHHLSVASSPSGESDLLLRLCLLFTSGVVLVA